MIISWKHKGLKRFFETGDTSGIQPIHAKKLRLQLGLLNEARNPEDLNIQGTRFHKLTGKSQEYYSLTVNKNWRIIFKFIDSNAILVDYLDYH